MAVGFETWLAFAAVTAAVVVVPGPTALLVIGQGLANGRRSVVPTTAGVVLGDLTAMIGVAVGVGTVIAASAAAYTALQWAGAAYLVYLGARLWRAAPVDLAAAERTDRQSAAAMVGRAYVVTALNPKTLLFFAAFLPQFIVADSPALPQVVVLGGTFLVLGGINAAAYGFLADRLGGVLARRNWRQVGQRAGAVVLIAAGAMAAILGDPV